MGLVFRCERTGLSTVLLGGYDGTGTWTIIGPDISDGAEHLVVQAHEAMHHELQLSTTWGRLCAILGLLGQRTARPARYLDLFDAAVDGSRTVHELYATVLSDGIATQRAARDVLADNRPTPDTGRAPARSSPMSRASPTTSTSARSLPSCAAACILSGLSTRPAPCRMGSSRNC
ncbi:MAG: hypothetical protein ABI047_11110 [Jatrophihabitantaceae bacterium]